MDTTKCTIEVCFDVIDNDIQVKIQFPKDTKKGTYIIEENSKKNSRDYTSLESCLLELIGKNSDKREENIKMVSRNIINIIVWR